MIGKEASPVVMLFAYALTTWVIAPTYALPRLFEVCS
jgi:hypothetical protein